MSDKRGTASRGEDTEASDPDLLPMDNPGDWEVVPEAEAVRVPSRLGTMVSVRLDPDTARLVRQAARIAGITHSEFLRRAVESAARSVVDQEPVRVVAHGGVVPQLVWSMKRPAQLQREQAQSTSTALDIELRAAS
jgi:uncharacterized protein (DUF1778 family)